MNTSVSVSRASLEECFEIVREPRLLKAFPVPEEELKDYLRDSGKEYYLVRAGDKKLLFYSSHLGNNIYDFHVACPRGSIIYSRQMVVIALAWVFHSRKDYLRALTTDCPEGKMANLCRKVGAREIKSHKGRVHFLMLPSDTPNT